MKKTPIVGIGASAGGLKEFELFFKNMPSTKELAFVIIQHLSPNHKSILADIVNRYTEMDVCQIKNNMAIQPGKVYIIPPNNLVLLDKEKLILKKPKNQQRVNLPIDFFFRSLKDNKAERAVALVLSGTGSDGSLGIKEVKEAGGLTIVQQPDTADYNGMPRSAIETGLIDFIIPVEEMPQVILSYVENGFQENKIIKRDNTSESLINQIFKIITQQTGHDFTNYKRNSVYRRIERRLTVKKTDNLKDYLQILKKDSSEVGILYKELLISVTSFFRDKEIFDFIEKKIVPQVVSNAEGNNIRIWVPACATGEEAYSWVILFKKYIDDHKLNNELQVFASDVDTDAIEKAREGFYTGNIAADVNNALLERYFLSEQNGYRVKKAIREMVVFAEQNIVQDPPYSRLNLVSCRNLMIYLNNHLQQKALSIFHYALKNSGYLVLGNSESLGNTAPWYEVVDRKNKVFRKNNTVEMSARVWNMTYDRQLGKLPDRKQLQEPISDIAREFILEKHTPPSVVINQEGTMLYVQGKMGKYLEIATGDISTNVFKTAKKGLKMPMSNALRKAKKNQAEAIHRNIRIQTDDSYEYVDIVVSPLKYREKETPLFVVMFKTATPPNKKSEDEENEHIDHATIEELEKELAEKEQYLQNTIEELETTNEELKSSNEEAQSTNEELQSSNEELETSREELQSVNEELETTNNELNIKFEELNRVNNDLKNLFSATDIATIFLDKELKIFSFTPAISIIIDLLQSDIGRSIKQFTNNLKYDHLIRDARVVLKTLIPKETEVQSNDNKYFWMRIIPYRTIDDKIEGVVITFTDITEKKQQEKELEKHRNHLEELVEEKSRELAESEEKFRTIFNMSLSMICIADLDTATFQFINPAFHRILGYTKEELLTKSFFEFIHPEDKKSTTQVFEENLKVGVSVMNFQNRFQCKDNTYRWIDWNYQPIVGKGIMYAIANDVTQSKKAEQELIKHRNFLKASQEIGSIGTWHFHLKENTLSWTEETYKIFGIDLDTPINYELLLEHVHPDEKEYVNRQWEKAIEKKQYDIEHRIIVNKKVKWVREKAEFVSDKDGNVMQAVGVVQDITHTKAIEEDLKNKADDLEQINREKDQFISVLAHDIKNPFGALLGFSELLVKNAESYEREKIKEHASLINNIANKTFNLLENTLLWSRTQTNKYHKEYIRLNVRDLLNGELEMLSPMAQEKEIQIENKLEKGLSLFTDASILKTVFRNLLSNAIKYTKDGGSIVVQAEKETNRIVFSVVDTGVGMSQQEQDRLFKLTHIRTKEGTKKEKGTGFGLRICKDLLKKVDGSIHVQSEPGKGSTFFFTIPINDEPKNKGEYSDANKDKKGKVEILIAEDDNFIFELMKELIASELKRNCKILRAENGEQAVEICKMHEIDLVFMDIKMPVMDGLEATEQIKKIKPDLPVTIQSANLEKKNIEKARDLGCKFFLEKPVDNLKLKKILKKTITG